MLLWASRGGGNAGEYICTFGECIRMCACMYVGGQDFIL